MTLKRHYYFPYTNCNQIHATWPRSGLINNLDALNRKVAYFLSGVILVMAMKYEIWEIFAGFVRVFHFWKVELGSNLFRSCNQIHATWLCSGLINNLGILNHKVAQFLTGVAATYDSSKREFSIKRENVFKKYVMRVYSWPNSPLQAVIRFTSRPDHEPCRPRANFGIQYF